jgi:heavy metal sensor kinase
MGSRFWFGKRPLRVRLTAWYVLLLGLILLLFSIFLYVQLQLSLFTQLDAALKLTTSYARNHLDYQHDPPTFGESKNLSQYLRQGNFAARLITSNGMVWDGLGSYQSVPIWMPQEVGYKNLSGDKTIWRVYSQPIQGTNHSSQGELLGWLQVAQSLAPAREAEARFWQQVLFSLPLVLLVAGWGGWFLANQALRPIDQMTRTAQRIGVGDLTQRIDYKGPADEVGRLATTFDQMLDRIQIAFDRERRFTADVSHELRTPLTLIKGQIGVTLSRYRDLAEYETTLQDIEQGVDRLVRLTNDLLFLARLDQGRLHYQMDKLNLSHLLEAVVEKVHLLAKDKQLDLIAAICPDLAIIGDPDYLIRLFLNLLDNAIKYTPVAGKITVQAEYQEARVCIIIQDTGPGISPEHLPHVFERFYRVERARDRSTGGTGLGLAIAYEITRLHNGTLALHSNFGDGTRFIVSLPSK